MLNRFFVYGTLKKGGHFAKDFNFLRKESKTAFLKWFDLYNLGTFPGIIEGKGEVKGELHVYENPKLVIKYFDIIEGYNSNNKKDSLFLRKEIQVRLENGTYTNANVYIFNGNLPADKCFKIKSGVW